MTQANKPRLLVLASTYPRWVGDPEPAFVHALARDLVGRFDVVALVPHAAGAPVRETMDGIEVQRFRYAPARFETLVNDGGIMTNLRRAPWKWALVPLFLVALAFCTWRAVRVLRPDIVHAHWLIPQGFIAALLRRWGMMRGPFVVTSHGADLFSLRSAPLLMAKRFIARQAAALTVVSTAMRDALQALGADRQNVTVQPMGVDLASRFVPDEETQREPHTLLFVGRLVEKKGLRYLIQAMPRVLAQHPEARLVIAGFGPELEARKAQVQALGIEGSVRFEGAVAQDALPRLYRQATAFVAPFVEAASGDQEGLGLVLVEALGCGCPVVTTRLPAVREVFGGDWPADAVAPGDAEALAAAIVRVLDNPQAAARNAQSQREALRARFDRRIVAEGYASLFERCIREARA